MANRYFVQNIEGDTAVIAGSDAAHLAKVLRTKPNDTLCLCDGAGYDYTAIVQEVSAKQIVCTVQERIKNTSEATLRTTLCVAFGKGDKMDWVVQKAVELGAASIVPFLAHRCVSRPKNDKQERFLRIAEEAAKQSGRGVLPTISPLLSFNEMLQTACQNERALLFHPGGENGLTTALGRVQTLSLITGPEGGFTDEEVATATAAGCHIVALGPRILRCETAPVATLAAAMALSGEW